MHTFTGASLTTAKREKEIKCPSADEWTNKMWQHLEYHLAIKRNEILIQHG